MSRFRFPASAEELDTACQQALVDLRVQLDLVAGVSGPRGEDNTLLPLDRALSSLLDVLREAQLASMVSSDPALRNAAAKYSSELEAAFDRGYSDPRMYAAFESIDPAGLDDEARRFREVSLERMRGRGVHLHEAERSQLEDLALREAELAQRFADNLRENVPSIVLDDSQVEGLPEDFLQSHRAGLDGQVRVNAVRTDYEVIMAYARDPQARQAVFLAYQDRGRPQNETVLLELLEARTRQARLLGFPSAAHRTLACGMMLSSPDAVERVLRQLEAATGPAAARLKARLLERKRKDEPMSETLWAWDVEYYVTRLLTEELAVDPLALRQYFDCDQTVNGLLRIAESLHGIAFQPDLDGPRWDPEVRIYDVLEDSRPIGRLYLDLHPRPGKFHGGAQILLRPGVRSGPGFEGAIACNVPRGALERDQVRVLFHEMGHFLHSLFSGQGSRYRLLANGAWEWDFVEVASILFERWGLDPQVLTSLCQHAQTGEPLPDALAQRLLASHGLDLPFKIRQILMYSWLSLLAHGERQPPDWSEIHDRLSPLLLGVRPADSRAPTSFAHLAHMGATYYTYAWSLTLAAALDERFTAPGARLDPVLGRRLRDCVLGRGGSRPASEMVRDFLGGDPQLESLCNWLEGSAGQGQGAQTSGG